MLGQVGHAIALGAFGALLKSLPVTAHNDGHCGKAAEQFTPVDMLSTPRPGAAIAAPGGKHALSLVNQWDSKTDVTTRTVYILDPVNIGTEPRALFSAPPGEISEALWLSERTVAYVNGSALYHFGVGGKDDGQGIHLLDFPDGIEPSSLKYEASSGSLVFSAAVWSDDGDLSKTAENDKKWADRGYTGTVYNDLFVRHWDTWRIPGRVYTLASTKINKKGNDSEEFMGSKQFTNLLQGTGLYSQMDAIDSSWFSISATHLALALKPPHLNVATHTRMNIYYLPLDTPGTRPTNLTAGDQGAISGVTFSPDGKKLAWLEMAQDGYESDKRVVVVHTFDDGKKGTSEGWTDNWDRSPSDLTWDHDSDSLYLLSEYNGRVLPYHLSHPGRLPTPIHFKGSTVSISMLDNASNTFLLTINSLTSPNEVFVLDLHDSADTSGDPDKHPREAIHQISNFSASHIDGRLDKMQGEEFWFKGVDGIKVMAWVIKPNGWCETDAPGTWPLAFFIHGGPQGAWEDSWSTRWNPAIFASMGYFIVSVNPTGSTGYGQEFTDRIKEHWGDRPFQDLVMGYQAALDVFPEIDRERTGALGASYGGYMINWINGHNVFGFKCLVYHDGILSTTDMFYSTEEIWFPTHDMGGSPVDARATYERWNPMNHVGEWATPQLVIQGGKDFRLAESIGIGTFTALQLQGVPSRFLYFPDENHWVLKASNSAKWHKEVLTWLDEWLGAGKEGPSSQHPNVTTPLT